MEAIVVSQLSANSLRVELKNGTRMMAGIASELRMQMTRLLPGQAILVEFSPYDLSKGRIVDVLDT
jgi:translation initiation factor IF-1